MKVMGARTAIRSVPDLQGLTQQVPEVRELLGNLTTGLGRRRTRPRKATPPRPAESDRYSAASTASASGDGSSP